MTIETLQNPRWAIRLASQWAVLHTYDHPSFAELIATVHAADRGKLDGVALGESPNANAVLFVHRGNVCGMVFSAGMPARISVGEDALPRLASGCGSMKWRVISVPEGMRGLIPMLAGLTAGGGSYRIRETGTNRSAHMQSLRDIKNSTTMFILAQPESDPAVCWLVFSDSEGVTRRVSISGDLEVSLDQPDSSRLLSQFRRAMISNDLRQAVPRYISKQALVSAGSDSEGGGEPGALRSSRAWFAPALLLGLLSAIVAFGTRMDRPDESAAAVSRPAEALPAPSSAEIAAIPSPVPVAYADGSVDDAPVLIESSNRSPFIAVSDTVRGAVVVSLLIGVDGSVLQSVFVSGPGRLSAQAAGAVSSWRFRPATLAGDAVACWTTLTLGERAATGT